MFYLKSYNKSASGWTGTPCGTIGQTATRLETWTETGWRCFEAPPGPWCSSDCEAFSCAPFVAALNTSSEVLMTLMILSLFGQTEVNIKVEVDKHWRRGEGHPQNPGGRGGAHGLTYWFDIMGSAAKKNTAAQTCCVLMCLQSIIHRKRVGLGGNSSH